MAYQETTSKRVIARRVAKLRAAMRLTQAEFAREFGVRRLAVWRWENGVKVPQLRHQRTLYAIEIRQANLKLERGRQKGR